MQYQMYRRTYIVSSPILHFCPCTKWNQGWNISANTVHDALFIYRKIKTLTIYFHTVKRETEK